MVDRRIGYGAESVAVCDGSDTGGAGDDRSIGQPRTLGITLNRQQTMPPGA